MVPCVLYVGGIGQCLCNPLGSHGNDCDVITRQCRCKHGVTGTRCDRCIVNYWGLFNGTTGCRRKY